MYDNFDLIQADEFLQDWYADIDDVWDDFYDTAVDDVPDCEE